MRVAATRSIASSLPTWWTMHGSVYVFFHAAGHRCTRHAIVAGIALLTLVAGCQNPFRRHAVPCGCAVECQPDEFCDGDPECCGAPICGEEHACERCGALQQVYGVLPCTGGLPYCACGHMTGLCRIPCEKCGCLLHFGEDSGYIGPVEPPRPPRFHPVPTAPVFWRGMPGGP